MPETLKAEVIWKGRMKFEGRSAYEQTIAIDVSPPHGDDAGAKPMELLLISLASCAGQVVISLLQKMRQDIRNFSLRATGTKHNDHPKVFTEIHLEIEAAGPGLEKVAVEKAVQMAEDKYCPVFAMLKKSVAIRTTIAVAPLSVPSE